MKAFKAYLILAISFLLISCEKKFVEIIPVIEVEKDMSITGGGDIKYFSFPTTNVGYASASTSFIYKTTNGGSSWNKINISNNKKCNGIEFFDANNGMCLMDDDVYVTSDGGQSWSIRGSGDFIGLTDNGIGVIGDCGNSACIVSTTTDKGQSFQVKGGMTYDLHFTYRAARVEDSRVIILSNNIYKHGNENAFNLINNTAFVVDIGGFNAYEKHNDIFLANNNSVGVLVGENGLVAEKGEFLGNEIYDRTYKKHQYKYYSVDGYNGLVLCVGEKSIATNMDIGSEEIWNEVLDENGNSFANTFYKVRFNNSSTLYISGSDGLILKATI